MVTKHDLVDLERCGSLILAKIHMVTKLGYSNSFPFRRLILAKIHMVTKLNLNADDFIGSLILAKIHMVTKLREP